MGSVEQRGDGLDVPLASVVETSSRNARRVVFADALPCNALGKVLEYRVRGGLIEPEG